MTEQTMEEKFDLFVETYEEDMRGDKDLTNGNRGVINTLRDILDRQKEYPSLSWLLKHRTAQTLSTILVVHVLLEWLQDMGGDAFIFILAYLGI